MRRLRSALATPLVRIRPNGSASSRLSPRSRPSTARRTGSRCRTGRAPGRARRGRCARGPLRRGVARRRRRRRNRRSSAAPAADGTKWIIMPPGETIAGSSSSCGAARAFVARREQRGGAVGRAQRVGGRQRRWRRRTAPCVVEARARVGAGLGVDDELDVALPVTASRAFVRCRPARAKPSCTSSAPSARRGVVVDAELEEGEAVERRCAAGGSNSSTPFARRAASPASPCAQPAAHLALEESSERIASTRGAPVRRLAEHVVEDLERERAGVARAQHLLEEAVEVELALAGEVAVSGAPTAARPSPAAARRPSARRRSARPGSRRCRPGRRCSDSVWKLSRIRPRCGWSARSTMLQACAVEVDVAAPGERLVADAQVAPGGALGERVQLRRRALGVVERVRRGVRADQHQRRAERLHQVELALGAVEACRGTASSGMPSKSRNGWYRSIARPRSSHIAAQLARRRR